MAERIDSHQHFWKYSAEEHGWIGEAMEVIRRDFLPADLGSVLKVAGIDGAISVQARQTITETEWLLDLADQHPFLRGVVGWVPLADAGVEGELERLAARPKLKGIRHVVQDEPDDSFILGDAFNRGVRLLSRFKLAYDILIYEKHLPQAIEFVDRHPNQVFVLDHIAKPRIREGGLSPWRERIAELARRENVYCKVSGMVTEADWKGWTEADLAPYLNVVLDAFGARRLMFGSDWPVMLLGSEYQRWVSTVERAGGRLSESERNRLLGGTAIEAYRL